MQIRKVTSILGTKRIEIAFQNEVVDFFIYNDEVNIYYNAEKKISIPTAILRDILNCDYLKEEGQEMQEEAYKPGDFVRVIRQGGHDFIPGIFVRLIKSVRACRWLAEAGNGEKSFIGEINFTKP